MLQRIARQWLASQAYICVIPVACERRINIIAHAADQASAGEGGAPSPVPAQVEGRGLSFALVLPAMVAVRRRIRCSRARYPFTSLSLSDSIIFRTQMSSDFVSPCAARNSVPVWCHAPSGLLKPPGESGIMHGSRSVTRDHGLMLLPWGWLETGRRNRHEVGRRMQWGLPAATYPQIA